MSLVIVLVVAVIVAALAAYALLSRRTPVAVAPPQDDDADGVVSEPVPIERIVRGIEPILLSDAAPPIVAVEAVPPPPVAEAASSSPAPAPADATEAATAESMPADTTQADALPPETAAVESVPAAEIRWTRRFARNGALDARTRLGLIRDLGLIRAPWGALLLVQAYDEEREPEYRRAALTALAAYRERDARATFEQALRSEDEQERAIAAGALIDLGAVRTLPS